MPNRFQFLFSEASEGDPGGGSAVAEPSAVAPEANAPQPADESKPWHADLDDSGQFKTGWLDRLPDNLKPFKETLGRYQSPDALAQALGNANHLLGSKAEAVVIPGDKSTPEQVAEFRSKMGVPGDPSGYDLKAPAQLPDGVQWDDEASEFYAKEFHALGIPKEAAQSLLAKHLEFQGQLAQKYEGQLGEQARTEHEAQVVALKQACGADYNRNSEKFHATIRSLGFDPADPDLAVIKGSAKACQLIVALGGARAEDSVPHGGLASGGAFGRAQANDVISNKGNPYYERYWAGDREVAAMVNRGLSAGY